MNVPTIPRLATNWNTLKFIIPITISLLCVFFTISVFNTYAQKVDQRFASQDSRMEGLNQTNDSYRQQVYNYLLTLSQQVNITSQDSLRSINNLTESNKILQNRIDTDERKLDNLTTYISSLNLSCTNTTTVIYNNSTTQIPVQQSCRQYLMQKYGLGPYFDVVACCNNLPPVGYSQECCTCYQ